MNRLRFNDGETLAPDRDAAYRVKAGKRRGAFRPPVREAMSSYAQKALRLVRRARLAASIETENGFDVQVRMAGRSSGSGFGALPRPAPSSSLVSEIEKGPIERDFAAQML